MYLPYSHFFAGLRTSVGQAYKENVIIQQLNTAHSMYWRVLASSMQSYRSTEYKGLLNYTILLVEPLDLLQTIHYHVSVQSCSLLWEILAASFG